MPSHRPARPQRAKVEPFTQIPNALFELLPTLSGGLTSLVFYLARETFGYHRQRTRKTNAALEAGTGLSEQGLLNALSEGFDRKLIKRSGARGCYEYELTLPKLGGQLSFLAVEDEGDDPKKVGDDTQKSWVRVPKKVGYLTPMLNKPEIKLKEIGGVGGCDPLPILDDEPLPETAPEPKLKSESPALNILLDVGVNPVKARALAATHSAAEIERQVAEWRAEWRGGQELTVNLLVWRIENRRPVAKGRADAPKCYSLEMAGDPVIPGGQALHVAAKQKPRVAAAGDLWGNVLAELSATMPPSTFGAWVADSRIAAIEGDTYLISLPNAKSTDWVKNRLEPAVRRSLSSMVGRRVQVVFIDDTFCRVAVGHD